VQIVTAQGRESNEEEFVMEKLYPEIFKLHKKHLLAYAKIQEKTPALAGSFFIIYFKRSRRNTSIG
jgi:hypothetical protein